MEAFLNPPISNLGYKGITKAAAQIPTWIDKVKDPTEIATVGMLMERGGTGGGMFRNFYADFLDEAAEYLESPALPTARKLFSQSAKMWTAAAGHIEQAATTGESDLKQASEIMTDIARIEEEAARHLVQAFPFPVAD